MTKIGKLNAIHSHINMSYTQIQNIYVYLYIYNTIKNI